MKILEIEVQADGAVVVHVLGVKGPECLTIAEAIRQGLGGEMEDQKKTPEFFEGAPVRRSSQVRRGQ